MPKFDSSNKMSQLYYQHYLSQLDGLTIAKEVVIIRAYSIVTILKLKANKKFNCGLYRDVQGHCILLPQNLGLLLTLLSLEFTCIDNVLWIIWTGKLLLQAEDLSKFITLQKKYIINILY